MLNDAGGNDEKILFYDTKSYDKESFEKQLANFPEVEIDFMKIRPCSKDCTTGKRI